MTQDEALNDPDIQDLMWLFSHVGLGIQQTEAEFNASVIRASYAFDNIVRRLPPREDSETA